MDPPESEKVDSLNADILKILEMDSPTPAEAPAKPKSNDSLNADILKILDSPDPRDTRPVVKKVLDGDSVIVAYPDGREERVRLYGYNAAEKGARPEKKAEEARAAMQGLLPEGTRVEFEKIKTDSYGRAVGNLFLPRQGGRIDVGKKLKDEGLIGDYDDEDFRPDEESFAGLLANIGLNIAAVPAMIGGMKAGATTGGTLGAFGGPFGMAAGTVLGGISGLVVPAVAAGVGGRELSAAVDRFFYDSDREATHTGTDIFIDAGLALPFSGIGRIGLGAHRMRKALKGTGSSDLSVWTPSEVFGRIAGRAEDIRSGGYLGELQVLEDTLEKALSKAAKKGVKVADDHGGEIGAIRERIAELKGPGAGMPFMQSGAEEGLGLLRDIVGGAKAQSHWVRTPYRLLMNSKNPAAQQAGKMMFIANHLDNSVRALESWYGEGMAKATKETLAKITSKSDRKAAKKEISRLLKEEGHTQFGKSIDEIDPLLQAHKQIHDRVMAEAFTLKQMSGVMQAPPFGGGYVPLQAQKDFVFSTLRPEIKQGIGKTLDAHLEKGDDVARAQLAAYLSRSGVQESQATRAAQMFIDERKSARGVHQYSRLYDPKTNEALLPEVVFDQDIMAITSSMFERDAILSTNSLLFGQKKQWYTVKDAAGKPMIGADGKHIRRQGWKDGPGLDTMEGDTLKLPLVPRKILESLKKTDLAEFKVAHEFFRERYAPQATSATAFANSVKKWTANALLTKNWALQLSEMAKATAFSSQGVQSVELGAKIAKQQGKKGKFRWAEATGAAQSSIDEQIGPTLIREMQRTGGRLHPAILARTADKTSRQFGAYAALGTTHNVAETAAREVRLGGKISSATKRQAMEILQDRGMDQDAAHKALAEAYEAAAGRAGMHWSDSAKNFVKKEGAKSVMPTLDDEILETGVRNLVGRWHFMTGAGMIAPVMRKPSVAAAMQFRSFLVQASSQFKNDVVEPIWLGLKTNDMDLFHLGLQRLARSQGHQWTTATPAVLVRTIQSGDSDADLLEISTKIMKESVGGTMGLAGTWAWGLGEALLTGDKTEASRSTQLLPSLSALFDSIAGIATGGHRVLSGEPARGVTEIAKSARPLVGAVHPVAGMVAEPFVNLAAEAAKAPQKKKRKLQPAKW